MQDDPAMSKNAHLIVMQHGLWGNHTNLDFLESQVKLHAEREGLVVRTLNSAVSEKNLTYDGVDVIG